MGVTTVTRPELASTLNTPPVLGSATPTRHWSRLAAVSELSRGGILHTEVRAVSCHHLVYLQITHRGRLVRSYLRMDWRTVSLLSRLRNTNCWLMQSSHCWEKESRTAGPFWSLAM